MMQKMMRELQSDIKDLEELIERKSRKAGGL